MKSVSYSNLRAFQEQKSDRKSRWLLLSISIVLIIYLIIGSNWSNWSNWKGDTLWIQSFYLNKKRKENQESLEIYECFFPYLLTWKGRWLLIIAVKKPDIAFQMKSISVFENWSFHLKRNLHFFFFYLVNWKGHWLLIIKVKKPDFLM